LRKTVTERPAPDAFIQHGDAFVRQTMEVIRDVMAQTGPCDAAAVGFTGQMAGTIGVDKDFKPTSQWSGTNDGRQHRYMLDMVSEHGERILRLSGANTLFTAPKIRWLKKEYPQDYARTRKFLGLSGFVAGAMAGSRVGDAVMDRTLLEWTGLADLENERWSEELCDRLEVDIQTLPRIVGCETIVGKLSSSMARECGLAEGIPLVAGAGDKSAGCLGAGAVEPGMMVDESASVSALSLCVDSFRPDTQSRTYEVVPAALPGTYLALSYIIGSGLTIDWFPRAFGIQSAQPVQDTAGTVYDKLDAMAAKVPPGADGLLCITSLGGRALPYDPLMRGSFTGLQWSHTPAHFYRAMLESFAFEYGCYLDAMLSASPDIRPRQVSAVGGGAESAFFTQLKADVLGIPYRRLARSDTSLLGTALLAGYATGIFPDIKKSAVQMAFSDRQFEPNPENHAYYAQRINDYKAVSRAMGGLYKGLASRPASR
jgi:xylulokinase